MTKRNIVQFFKSIYGTPLSKTEIIRKVLKKYNYNENKVLFIGDAMSDYIDNIIQSFDVNHQACPDDLLSNLQDLKAKISQENGKSGYVLDENLTVGCGSGSIQILELQRQGKNIQTTKEFLKGKKISKGTILT